MANVRCIPIKASEALATCHLAIECERTLRQQLISYATAITDAAIVYRQSTIDEFKLTAQLEPEWEHGSDMYVLIYGMIIDNQIYSYIVGS